MSEIEQLRSEVKALRRTLRIMLPTAFEKVKFFDEWDSVPKEEQFRRLQNAETRGLEYVIYAQSKYAAEADYLDETGESLCLSLVPHTNGELWSISVLKMLLGYTEEKRRPPKEKPVDEAPFDL